MLRLVSLAGASNGGAPPTTTVGVNLLPNTATPNSGPGFAIPSPDPPGKSFTGPRSSPVGTEKAAPLDTMVNEDAAGVTHVAAGHFGDTSSGHRRDTDRGNDASASSHFNVRELGTYLGISFAVLIILCAMAAFMTWKALQNKRRRTASEFDVDDTAMMEPAANAFELDSADVGANGSGSIFEQPAIIDDEELRWKGCDVELSPSDSGVVSMGSPFSASDHDAAILFGPEGSLTPSLHVPNMLDEGDAEAMTPNNLKKRAFRDESATAGVGMGDLSGGSAGPSSASTSYEPSSPVAQGTPLETPPILATTAPPAATAKPRRRSPAASAAAQKDVALSSNGDVADGRSQAPPSKARRRSPQMPEQVPTSKSAIAAFMSGGSQTRHLRYETSPAGGSSASTTVSSPMDRTPSPGVARANELTQQTACATEQEPSFVAYSNIKLLET